MADITYVTIPDLTAAQDSQVTDSALIEMAVVDANGTNGYSSRKVTKEQLLSDLKSDIGDLDNLTTTAKNNLVAAINEAAQSGGGGGSSLSPYTSDPAALGTASSGSSSDYARGDHVHPMPSASDVGAIASPSSPSSGDFLVYNGSAWAAQSLNTWQGGNY